MLTYLPAVAPVIAIINSVIAVYIAQFKPEDGRVKVVLLSIAIGLGCAASGATIWTQHIVSQKELQEKERKREIRERLAVFITEGQPIVAALQAADADHTMAKAAAERWYADASAYLASLGPEYTARFNNMTGMPSITPVGVTDTQLIGYWVGVYNRTARLEQFASEFSH